MSHRRENNIPTEEMNAFRREWALKKVAELLEEASGSEEFFGQIGWTVSVRGGKLDRVKVHRELHGP